MATEPVVPQLNRVIRRRQIVFKPVKVTRSHPRMVEVGYFGDHLSAYENLLTIAGQNGGHETFRSVARGWRRIQFIFPSKAKLAAFRHAVGSIAEVRS